MAIPGHLVFISIIWRLATDHIEFSIIFLILYISAALIQVNLLSFKRN